MKIEVDMKEVTEYVNNFKAFSNGLEQWLKEFMLNEAIAIFDEILQLHLTITATSIVTGATGPAIDTTAMINSWYIDRPGIARENVTIDAIKVMGDMFEVTVGNPQEYASFVEYGTPGRQWKWQDGAHMMTIGVNNVYEALPKELTNDFLAYVRKNCIA